MLTFRSGIIARSVAVEIVGFCNADCTFCPSGSSNISSKTKFMDVERFEKIVGHLLHERIISPKGVLGLFHTSEAFLHPKINLIFDVLERHGLKAQVSSNFIRYPKLEKRHYKNLGVITFSLCSFKKDRYKKVYGADIDAVLENFNTFVKNIRDSGTNVDIQVNWIRYRYNQDEEEYAKHYFQTVLGVKLNIVSAILLDMQQYENILLGDDTDKIEQFDEDIFLSEQLTHMLFVKSLKASFLVCEEFYNIVVDVNGDWVRCCRTSNRETKNIIGTFEDIVIDRIVARTTDESSVCKFCSSYLIPDSAYLVESAVNIESLMNILDIKQGNNYAIYGSGHLAQVVFGVINNNQAYVSCFIDDTKKGKLFDVDVVSFEEFEKLHATTDIAIIVSATSSTTISKIKDKISSSSLPKNIGIISL